MWRRVLRNPTFLLRLRRVGTPPRPSLSVRKSRLKISWSCSNLSSVSARPSTPATSAFVASVGLSHSTPVLNCMPTPPRPPLLRDAQTIRAHRDVHPARRRSEDRNHPLGSLSHASPVDTNTSCPRFAETTKTPPSARRSAGTPCPPSSPSPSGRAAMAGPPSPRRRTLYREVFGAEWYGIPSDSHSRTVAASRSRRQ